PPRSLPSFPTRRSSDLSIALARLRKPVVHERRVLAPVQHPEERVMKGFAAKRRRSDGGKQNAGCAIVFLGRVVHERRVEQRHALDRKSTRLNSSHVASS